MQSAAAIPGETIDQRVRGAIVDVEERDLASLLEEVLGERFADAGAAAGDEDDTIGEAWIRRATGVSGVRIGHRSREGAFLVADTSREEWS